jgi:type IV pilus assembly protein PilB
MVRFDRGRFAPSVVAGRRTERNTWGERGLMGLLRPRREAQEAFGRYIEAVEAPPEVDDYDEAEEAAAGETAVMAADALVGPAPNGDGPHPGEPPIADGADWVGDRVDAARPRRLGELLVDAGLVTEAQLTAALAAQSETGRRLGDQLVASGLLDERDLASTLARQFGLDVVDLRKQVPEEDAVVALDEATAREMLVIPLRRNEFGFDVAVADPSVPGISDTLLQVLRQPAKLHVAALSDLRRAIDVAYKATARVSEHVRVFEARARALRRETAPEPVAQVDENAPVVQVVQALLEQAAAERASDIHIEPQDDRVRVRNRVDGALHDVLDLPVTMGPALVSRIKVMADMNIVERRRPQDGQMEVEVSGGKLDVRVSTTSTVHGEKAVLRLLDKRRALFELSDLGMPHDTYEEFLKLVRSPYGMVICAGPTGSGKTTTLYATLAKISRPEINVMTVEDPVEYVFPGVNQIQINEQAGITFATGLRSILRQDPDCILIGEIRDVETARMAVQSALTGHLVLSSIHATDAVAALHRFLDMKIESFLVASSVLCVVGQRRVRRICPECKAPYDLSADEAALWKAWEMPDKAVFWRGEGCTFCAHTGYQGRIGVYEVLRTSDELKALIVENAPHERIREVAVEQGMRPLARQALQLVYHDVTTIPEIARTIYVV